jgi:hypothetical protein
MVPIGRGTLRDKGTLPMLQGQATAQVAIDFEVLDTVAQFEDLEKHARALAGG